MYRCCVGESESSRVNKIGGAVFRFVVLVRIRLKWNTFFFLCCARLSWIAVNSMIHFIREHDWSMFLSEFE